jgi:hypothetical protein
LATYQAVAVSQERRPADYGLSLAGQVLVWLIVLAAIDAHVTIRAAAERDWGF